MVCTGILYILLGNYPTSTQKWVHIVPNGADDLNFKAANLKLSFHHQYPWYSPQLLVENTRFEVHTASMV